ALRPRPLRSASSPESRDRERRGATWRFNPLQCSAARNALSRTAAGGIRVGSGGLFGAENETVVWRCTRRRQTSGHARVRTSVARAPRSDKQVLPAGAAAQSLQLLSTGIAE